MIELEVTLEFKADTINEAMAIVNEMINKYGENVLTISIDQ